MHLHNGPPFTLAQLDDNPSSLANEGGLESRPYSHYCPTVMYYYLVCCLLPTSSHDHAGQSTELFVLCRQLMSRLIIRNWLFFLAQYFARAQGSLPQWAIANLLSCLKSVRRPATSCFFFQSPSWTTKTYTINLVACEPSLTRALLWVWSVAEILRLHSSFSLLFALLKVKISPIIAANNNSPTFRRPKQIAQIYLLTERKEIAASPGLYYTFYSALAVYIHATPKANCPRSESRWKHHQKDFDRRAQ